MTITPPKPIEEMTYQEKEQWERTLENDESLKEPNCWDTLEELRRTLNDSYCENMYYLKKHSKYGSACGYYQKALILFQRDQFAGISSLLDKFKEELEKEPK